MAIKKTLTETFNNNVIFSRFFNPVEKPIPWKFLESLQTFNYFQTSQTIQIFSLSKINILSPFIHSRLRRAASKNSRLYLTSRPETYLTRKPNYGTDPVPVLRSITSIDFTDVIKDADALRVETAPVANNIVGNNDLDAPNTNSEQSESSVHSLFTHHEIIPEIKDYKYVIDLEGLVDRNESYTHIGGGLRLIDYGQKQGWLRPISDNVNE